MQHIIAAQHRLHCEQRQDYQRPRPNLRVGNRGPSQRSQHYVTDQRNGQATHVNQSSLAKDARDFASGLSLRLRPLYGSTWCTGKDSNLRTSLGGTDLQSVGFNHSPTCAKILGRCGCRTPSGRPPCGAAGKHSGQNPQTKRSTRHFIFATQGNQDSSQTQRDDRRISDLDHCTPEKYEWSALEKPVAPPNPPSAGNTFPGAGEGI
jgi:hypothetical protein